MSIAKNFLSDRRSNVVIMISLAVVGVIGLVGLAVDYNRATSVEARIASTADSAVLAGARHKGTEAERVAVANTVFQASLGKISGTSNFVFTPGDVSEGGKTVAIKGSASVRLNSVFGTMHS